MSLQSDNCTSGLTYRLGSLWSRLDEQGTEKPYVEHGGCVRSIYFGLGKEVSAEQAWNHTVSSHNICSLPARFEGMVQEIETQDGLIKEGRAGVRELFNALLLVSLAKIQLQFFPYCGSREMASANTTLIRNSFDQKQAAWGKLFERVLQSSSSPEGFFTPSEDDDAPYRTDCWMQRSSEKESSTGAILCLGGFVPSLFACIPLTAGFWLCLGAVNGVFLGTCTSSACAVPAVACYADRMLTSFPQIKRAKDVEERAPLHYKLGDHTFELSFYERQQIVDFFAGKLPIKACRIWLAYKSNFPTLLRLLEEGYRGEQLHLRIANDRENLNWGSI